MSKNHITVICCSIAPLYGREGTPTRNKGRGGR